MRSGSHPAIVMKLFWIDFSAYSTTHEVQGDPYKVCRGWHAGMCMFRYMSSSMRSSQAFHPDSPVFFTAGNNLLSGAINAFYALFMLTSRYRDL